MRIYLYRMYIHHNFCKIKPNRNSKTRKFLSRNQICIIISRQRTFKLRRRMS